MPDEELKEFKEFMLESQAQSEARMGKLEENMGRLEGIVTRLATATLNRFETLEDKVNILIDSQIKLTEKMREVADSQEQANRNIAELAEAQAHTDKRLDALIDIVREGRNGTS